MRSQSLVISATLAALAEAKLNNGLGTTPAMGWNSYVAGGCAEASEASALTTANLFVSLGLKDLGYTYVNIDDCWTTKTRDGSGNLVPDPAKWPNGVKAVADEIHSLGLKFGLFGDAGINTCQGFPGSEGHEDQDAKLIASFDVDYWKYDNCYTPCGSANPPQMCRTSDYNVNDFFGAMRDALANSGRDVLFSMDQWGREDVWQWGANFANSWRIALPIQDTWDSVVSIASVAGAIAEHAGPGGFNDLDVLEVGNTGLTAEQERTHFGIWAIAKSPLLLGTDLSKISSESLDIIKNKGLIDINQDSLGLAAGYFTPEGASPPVSGTLHPYWTGKLSDGVVVGLVAASGAQTLSVDFKDVPGLGSDTYSWTEMYTGAKGTGSSVSFDLAAYDMAVVKIST